jgi:replicative DNA helicase
MAGELTPENLKTYLHAHEQKNLAKLLNILRQIDTEDYVYTYEEVLQDLEREYLDGLMRKLKMHAMSKDATTESIANLTKETVMLMSQNTKQQFVTDLEDSIDDFREKVKAGLKDDFSDSIIKPTGIYSRIFAGSIYPFVYVIMTRPRGGKTALAMNIIKHLTSLQKKSVFFALSDDVVQTVRAKYLGACSGVPINNLVNYDLNDTQKEVLGKYVMPGKPRMIKVIDKPGLSGDKIIQIIENLFIDGKYEAIFIDYIQRIGRNVKQSRKEDIDMFMAALVTISKKYGVAIFVLSQVSRLSEEKTGAVKLQLNDAKETGNIDEDARACLVIDYADFKDSARTLKWVKTTYFPYSQTEVNFDWASGRLHDDC